VISIGRTNPFAGFAIVLVTVLVIAGVLYLFVYPKLPSIQEPTLPPTQPSTTPVQPAGQISLTRPLKISLVDAVGDNADIDGTVYLYTEDGTLVDTITVTDSVGTSTKYYTSGQKFLAKIAPTDFVTVWMNLTVPMGQTAEDQYLHVQAEVIDLGTWSPKVMKPDGTYIENGDNSEKGASYKLDKTDASKPTLTFEIRNTEDDSGWMESYDPLLKRDYKCVFYFELADNPSASGTGKFEDIIVTGTDMQMKAWTTKRVWFIDIPAESLIREVDPTGKVVKSGVYQATVTLDLSGWTDSSEVLCTYGIATYTSADYYDYYGYFGTLSTQTERCFPITQ